MILIVKVLTTLLLNILDLKILIKAKILGSQSEKVCLFIYIFFCLLPHYFLLSIPILIILFILDGLLATIIILYLLFI